MEKWSLAYEIIKYYFWIPATQFFRKIIAEGVENIPKDKPVIFAPNHQNAIMDPLAIIYTTNKQPVFLARGDAFNNNTIAKIFAVFKILPVFRQRDGLAQLKKNEAIFQKSVDVLKNNNSFCLFPEGQHNPRRFLRSLQKAIPRIAFQAEEQTDFKLDIKIIPTGIYFTDKTKALSVVYIHYGKAINVLDYVDLYKENQQKGINALKMKMSEELKPLIIDIQDQKNYDLIEDFLTVNVPHYLEKNNLKNTQKNKFNASKIIIEEISDKIDKDDEFVNLLSINILNLKTKITNQNILFIDFFNNDKSFRKTILKSMLLIIILPLFILAFIINILPLQIPPYISKNLLKDPQYIGSVKFSVGGIIFPIYYLILSLISIFFIDIQYSIIVLFFLPLLGLLYVYYKHTFKNLSNSFKYLFLSKAEKDNITEIIDKINEDFLNQKS
jgi:1-acyl-sn-glycerol-3-phosphate acyltransferase